MLSGFKVPMLGISVFSRSPMFRGFQCFMIQGCQWTGSNFSLLQGFEGSQASRNHCFHDGVLSGLQDFQGFQSKFVRFLFIPFDTCITVESTRYPTPQDVWDIHACTVPCHDICAYGKFKFRIMIYSRTCPPHSFAFSAEAFGSTEKFETCFRHLWALSLSLSTPPLPFPECCEKARSQIELLICYVYEM